MSLKLMSVGMIIALSGTIPSSRSTSIKKNLSDLYNFVGRYFSGSFGPPSIEIAFSNRINRYSNKPLPSAFDTWSKWQFPYNNRRDQGECRGAWAISTIEVISERLSIERIKNQLKHSTVIVNNSQVNPVCLSSKQVILCNTENRNQGCLGGFPDNAWNWVYEYSGDVFNEESFPWDKTSCDAPVFKKDKDSLSKELFTIGKVFRISGEENIMREIESYGPVQATMMLFDDMYTYSPKTVYKHSKNAKLVGWHSVRIIGWGSDKGTEGHIIKYWVVVNSWGIDWGDQGIFWIERGNNECAIESHILAADVSISDNKY